MNNNLISGYMGLEKAIVDILKKALVLAEINKPEHEVCNIKVNFGGVYFSYCHHEAAHGLYSTRNFDGHSFFIPQSFFGMASDEIAPAIAEMIKSDMKSTELFLVERIGQDKDFKKLQAKGWYLTKMENHEEKSISS